MQWLMQHLFDQLTRVDLARFPFFNRFHAMDPDSRPAFLADIAHALARHGRLAITVDGEHQGHFSLLLLWTHEPLPRDAETVDLDTLMRAMDTLDEEIQGEREHWKD
jgi:hypothetical protein